MAAPERLASYLRTKQPHVVSSKVIRMESITIVGAPTSAGAYAPGQERAPLALREAGLIAALEARGAVVQDAGDGPLQRWAPDAAAPRAQNRALVTAAIARASESVKLGLREEGLVLLLGGDCTVGVAAISALKAMEPAAALCYLDLHADMNTPTSVIDGALDWMGMGCALGLPGAEPGVAPPGLLQPAELVLIGFDSSQASAWERTEIERLGIAVVPVDAVASDPRVAARTALGKVASAPALAVHFDVDLIDFTDAPLSENTGRNIGVTLDCAAACLAALAADRRVRIVTITELNPLHGAEDGSTLRRFIQALADALVSARTRVGTG
jgi:arginase